MKFELTPILIAAIAIVSAVLMKLLIPWLRTKTTAEQFDQLVGWAKIAAKAAEMLFSGTKRGDEKLEYVTGWLTSHGFTYNEETVRTAIESAVWELKNEVR